MLIYITTVFIASIIPGPSMLLALNHGIKYGIKPSVITALGNVAATLVQAILTIVGLSILLLKINIVFTVIKYAGAAYIIYIGISTILHADNDFGMSQNETAKKKNFIGIFNESFLVTIGNPKAIIFFTALFPQFINRSNETAYTSCILVVLLLMITFICMMAYVVFGQNISKILTSTKRKCMFNRVIGCSFFGIGIGLLFCKVDNR